ncbi:hypothetical protein [Streptomyces griseorubiginosus]|uniref:hypothetical protein n=1 Tax=Streptomyces griseorubiginosus TaxID=67304 RepID=UPI00332FEE7E
MPISNADQQRVTMVRKAADRLREVNSPELAEHVDFLLTDEGRKFVGRLNWQKTADDKPNLAMQMPEELRDLIKGKAAAAGASLTAEAEHALQEFLDGRFTPAPSERAVRFTRPKRVNLNVRVSRELRRRADDLGKELLAEGELDWAPRASHVIVQWFTDRVEEDFQNPVKKQQAQ